MESCKIVLPAQLCAQILQIARFVQEFHMVGKTLPGMCMNSLLRVLSITTAVVLRNAIIIVTISTQH